MATGCSAIPTLLLVWLHVLACDAARMEAPVLPFGIKINIFPCKVDSPYGKLDRWLSVTPVKENAAVQVKHWVANQGWETMLDDLNSPYRKPLPFSPFIFRNLSEYEGRELVRTTTIGGKQDGCESSYSAQCVEEDLSILETIRCGSKTSSKKITLLPLKTSTTVCTAEEDSIEKWGWFNQEAWHRTAFVLSNLSEPQKVPMKQCVKIEAKDPTKGINLYDLDGDLMGMGTDGLAKNATKVQHIIRMAEHAGEDFVNGIVDAAGQIVEGGMDIADVADAQGHNLTGKDNLTEDVALKWVKRATLASMVNMCLCCNTDIVETNETMASHCKFAYTLGGQNKTRNGNVTYWTKVTAGTLFNVAKTIGGVLVPFVGGGLVEKGHEEVCQYTCSLRKAYLYEPYRFGKVREVPGMAVSTWLAR